VDAIVTAAPSTHSARRTTPATLWPLLMALLALLLGALVYVSERAATSAQWLPAWAAWPALQGHWFGVLGQWLPSFVHVFAFSVLTALLLPRRAHVGDGACVFWLGVNLLFELGQWRPVALWLVMHLQPAPEAGRWRQALAAYFSNGTFDAGDVLAAVLGGVLAALLLRSSLAVRS
jgi:hypothetical protein